MTSGAPILPVEAYTSQEWFDLEQQHIFSKNWYFAGLVEDLNEPGEFKTVQAGLNNIFIILDKNGELSAFHNICRHRGTQLLRAAGKAGKAITCPYHDWTYSLNGDLISVPEEASEFQGIDKSCHGLKKASVGIWRGMLFVHPEEKPIGLQEWFSGVKQYLGPHQPEELIEYTEGRTSETIKANWKIVVENYIDVYHLSHLHSGTLSMYDHKNAEFGFVGPHYAFWEPLSDHYAKEIGTKSPLPLIVDNDHLGAWVPMLFPGLGLAESEGSWSTFHIIPLAPDLTRVETRTKVKDTSIWEFTKQEWQSASFWEKHSRGKYPKVENNDDDPMTSGDFMAEDIYACEQQQKSLKSPYFEVGQTAKYGESPVREHQKIILDIIQSSK